MVVYHRKFREYGALFSRSTVYMIMAFCCFCGKELPTSLRDEWFDTLEKEYGIEASMGMTKKEMKHVLSEFFTDEWCKKRGW